MLLKHLFVIQKLRLIGSTFFGFAQNSLHDFQNTVYELIVALSSTNDTTKRFCSKKKKEILPVRQRIVQPGGARDEDSKCTLITGLIQVLAKTKTRFFRVIGYGSRKKLSVHPQKFLFF